MFGFLSLANNAQFILYTDISMVILKLACGMLLCLYNLGLLFVLLSICLCFTLHCICVNKDYYFSLCYFNLFHCPRKRTTLLDPRFAGSKHNVIYQHPNQPH